MDAASPQAIAAAVSTQIQRDDEYAELPGIEPAIVAPGLLCGK